MQIADFSFLKQKILENLCPKRIFFGWCIEGFNLYAVWGVTNDLWHINLRIRDGAAFSIFCAVPIISKKPSSLIPLFSNDSRDAVGSACTSKRQALPISSHIMKSPISLTAICCRELPRFWDSGEAANSTSNSKRCIEPDLSWLGIVSWKSNNEHYLLFFN